ncbi:protein mono-ADP-ribosyltransferase PARP12-like isoform X1 [Ostrea edulis]|uniref:protein mono-ADP-ribosyltransferase PARP12-like isoform X1 n=1 Tax=Ostrea edulis TaxID=37623 RepID=UPI0024AEC56E|nr:protein mono-ADP-ribosyltransferase PARP12-like isoform X1 [Ostrea edulis]XP_048752817.2 protein mono-ADP-ribosyltransferase PARP12-like isoform X1 [Ostrea edulis]XP_048752820.2 protein mono-ADP-ribosyltransferase PARP12-like isoform X1 [Ostrea edulis]XP_048752821.2 protein mono-ADP-ribosyltransferase PARP12-like isoform X1 [Ostrea edulis]XP_048752822.2 protein mono-ADP-ribosyltransferase PARP12-like isoform X1 [Ostrea edulis]XP_048752823.2 protein mono-ADP-ribosyltransferase PARP12-like is
MDISNRGGRGRGRKTFSATNSDSGRSRGRGRRRRGRGRGWNNSAQSRTRSKSVESADNDSECSYHWQSSRKRNPGRPRGRSIQRGRGRGWGNSARSRARSKSAASSDNDTECSYHWQSSRKHGPGRSKSREIQEAKGNGWDNSARSRARSKSVEFTYGNYHWQPSRKHDPERSKSREIQGGKGRGWGNSARSRARSKSAASSDNDSECNYWRSSRRYDTDNESVCSFGSQSTGRGRGQGYAVGRGPIKQQSARKRNQNIFDFSAESVFKFLVKKTGGLSSVSKLKEEFTSSTAFFSDRLLEEKERLSIFKRQNNPVCIGPFVKKATFCFDHGTHRGCRRTNCYNFHICKFYLNGWCKHRDRCQKGHSFTDYHNDNIKENLGLQELTDDEIKVIILCRYPQACRAQSCSAGENCPYLHICYNFLMDKCDDDNCQRGHSFETPHNQWVLRVYKMERWPTQKLPLLKWLINMPRRQLQQSDTSMYVPRHPMFQTSDETEYDCMSVDDDEDLKCIVTKMTSRGEKTINSVHDKVSKDVEKQLATSISLKDSYAHKKDICLIGLSGTCQMTYCDHHHTRLPYMWQINIYGDWVSFDEEENEKLEQRYCNLEDVAHAEVEASTKYGVVLYFTKEYATLQFGGIINTSSYFLIRRLSTASFAKDNAPLKFGSFHTQWRWYYENDYGQWMLYDKDVLQHTLEKKYITGQRSYLFTRESHKLKYKVEFSNWKQTNIETSKVRKILRRPVFVSRAEVTRQQFPILLDVKIPEQAPPHWDPIDLAHDFELVDLEKTGKEYSGVKTAFFATLKEKNFQISNIYRVQNLALWKEYTMKKSNMERVHAKNVRSVDERSLFHGTDSFDTCYGICTNNFDFRLSGKNATMYGKGSYFAVTSNYSNSYTKGPTRLMFQAKVMVGSYTKGTHDMTCPPIIPGEGHKRYDSCINDGANPSIFVIFDRNQCYPEYLIAYKEINVESSVDIAVPTTRQIRPAATTVYQPTGGATAGSIRNSQRYSTTSHLHTSNQASVSSYPTSSQTPTPRPSVTPSSSSLGHSNPTSSQTNSFSSPRSLSNTHNQQSSASVQPRVPSSYHYDQKGYNRQPASPTRSSVENVYFPVRKKKDTCTVQ